ncbi:MAG: hypothetical protein COB49_02000 [Alphaproteobacteria bacterium]|nr:MAG: hypothetical protein COB49_02000 [Alphaproteobacteria bacterium]
MRLGLGLGITAGGFVAAPGIAMPVLSLTGGTVDAPLLPQLNTGAFTPINGAVDTHASTDWQIATDAAFITIVWSALASASLTQITVGLALNETTTYYARARHNGATYQSKYSTAVMFNTLTVFVTTPAITSPAPAATGISETPAITSSAFAVTNGSDAHASTDWQVAGDAGFTTIVAQSLADATNLESWTIPAGNLLVNTGYFVRVRHTGTAQGASAWSPAISFTTAAAFANPWDLGNVTYDNKALDVSAQGTLPTGMAISPDGTRLFVVCASNNTMFQYNLSVAGDISTAVYSGTSRFVGNEESSPEGLALSADGMKIYLIGGVSKRVYQYNLAIPFFLATTGVTGGVFMSQDNAPTGISFSADGMKLYMTGRVNNRFYQYNLSTAWAANSASYSGISLQHTLSGFLYGCFISPDGTRLFGAVSNKDVRQWNLGTANNIGTGGSVIKSVILTAQVTSISDVNFSADGTKMYVVNRGGSTIEQYSL